MFNLQFTDTFDAQEEDDKLASELDELTAEFESELNASKANAGIATQIQSMAGSQHHLSQK